MDTGHTVRVWGRGGGLLVHEMFAFPRSVVSVPNP